MRSGGMMERTCKNVARRRDVSPKKARNGLGRSSRLSGQKRSPLPPARMTACRIGRERYHATGGLTTKGGLLCFCADSRLGFRGGRFRLGTFWFGRRGLLLSAKQILQLV